MSVSVIILHYGSKQYTGQAVESVQRHSPNAEIVVVDNQGDWGGPGDIVRPGRNLGFAAGCNEGTNYTHGDRLVFLNNDTRVREGWLDALELELSDPTTGAAGPLLLYPDNRVQCSGVDVDFSRAMGEEAWNLQSWIDAPRTRKAVTGACLAIRAEVFNEVGGFDTGFWNGYEDVDLCLKLREAGYRIVCTPHSQVVHYESQSDPQERFRCVRENVLRLRGKWDPAWRTVTPQT